MLQSLLFLLPLIVLQSSPSGFVSIGTSASAATLSTLPPSSLKSSSSIGPDSAADCKATAAAFASLGLLDALPMTGASEALKSGGPATICNGPCCNSRSEAYLVSVARKQLADMLRNYLATAANLNSCFSQLAAGSVIYQRFDLIRRELPATAAAAATNNCLARRIQSGFCSLCRGGVDDNRRLVDVESLATGWTVDNLRQCLLPLAPLAPVWERLVDQHLADGASCVASMRDLFTWQALFKGCRKSAAGQLLCSAPSHPAASYRSLRADRSLTVSNLASILDGLSARLSVKRRRRQLGYLSSSLMSSGSPSGGGVAPPSPRPPSKPQRTPTSWLYSGGGQPPLPNSNLTSSADVDQSSGHYQPPTILPPSARPPSPSTSGPIDQQPSGEFEPPTSRGNSDRNYPPNRVTDVYPPLPDPNAPPPPDLWLPKTYPDDGDSGGAVISNRGEGSIHGPPQMVAMRGQRRECLYSDPAKCPSMVPGAGNRLVVANRIGVSLGAIVGLASVLIVRF